MRRPPRNCFQAFLLRQMIRCKGKMQCVRIFYFLGFLRLLLEKRISIVSRNACEKNSWRSSQEIYLKFLASPWLKSRRLMTIFGGFLVVQPSNLWKLTCWAKSLLPFSNRALSQCSWATCCTIDGMQCLGTDEERNQQFTLHCVLEKYHAPCNNFPCDNKICLNMIIAPKLDVNWPLSDRGKGRRVCFLGSHRSKMR